LELVTEVSVLEKLRSFLREDKIKCQKDWHKGATMTARFRSCMLNNVQCSLMCSPHDLYEGGCVVDCTSIGRNLFARVLALPTGSLVHFYVIERIRKKKLTSKHKKAVSTMASTGHFTHDKAHVPSLCQQTKSSEDARNEFSADKCLWILQVMP